MAVVVAASTPSAKVMPSMRALMTAGPALAKENLAAAKAGGKACPDPARDVPAFDTTAQAMSGLLALVLGSVDREVTIRAFLSDVLAGVFACNGVLAALNARHLTGKGQEVRTSPLQAGGIQVLPPDVNRSIAVFSCDAEKKEIYYALAAVLLLAGGLVWTAAPSLRTFRRSGFATAVLGLAAIVWFLAWLWFLPVAIVQGDGVNWDTASGISNDSFGGKTLSIDQKI